MADPLSLRLVPDELWELVEPHLPQFRPRPQGGGADPLPGPAGVHVQAAHRRFAQ